MGTELYQGTVCEYIDKLENCITSTTEAEYLGCLVHYWWNAERVCAMILMNRMMTVVEVSNQSWSHPWNHLEQTKLSWRLWKIGFQELTRAQLQMLEHLQCILSHCENNDNKLFFFYDAVIQWENAKGQNVNNC